MKIIILVVLLCFPEYRSRLNLGHHVVAFFLQQCDQLLGDLFLLLVAVKNGRQVLFAPVGPLVVPFSLIVDLKKELCQLFI